MIIRGIIFDINGTLIDILTDDGDEGIYRAIGHFLSYQGIYLHRGQVRDMYRDIFGAGQLGMKTVFFAPDRVIEPMQGVDPDYIIYQVIELRQAIRFFEGQPQKE